MSILKSKLLSDGLPLHFVSSAIAGFTAAVIGSPVDVVKTRFMNQDKNAKDAYKGVVDTFVRTFREEGFFAFYKGFVANATRIISWNIVVRRRGYLFFDVDGVVDFGRVVQINNYHICLFLLNDIIRGGCIALICLHNSH